MLQNTINLYKNKKIVVATVYFFTLCQGGVLWMGFFGIFKD
jgi:hypothetical protein